MESENIIVRYMKHEDVDEVLEIWSEIGLHEGTQTIHSFLEVDPQGFVVAQEKDSGRLIGMCTGCFVSPDTAFIGLYGVRAAFRGLGIGIRMWNKMMEHIDVKNAGLYAVPEQLATYRDKAGFRIEDQRHLVIYECDAKKREEMTKNLVQEIPGVKVVPIGLIGEDVANKAMSYDAQVHGYSREKLLKFTFVEKDSIAMVAIDEKTGNCLGYGVFRTNNANKAMTGPVYADNDPISELLIYQLISHFPVCENGILYMTLDSNPGGMKIAEKLGLELHEELPRFFTKHATTARFDRIYCIHTPNFSLY